MALVIVDVQATFLDLFKNGVGLLRRCAFAVEAAKLLGVELLYTEQYPEKLESIHPELKEVGLAGAKGFSKKSFSIFGAEGFKEYLEEREIRHLLIAGLETGICVYQSVLDGLKEGYDVTMLSDCVMGRRDEDSRAVIAALQKTECHRLPAETVFYSILRTAEDPRYKAFNEIVKKYS